MARKSGFKHPPEVREKISKARKGSKMSEATKAKIRQAHIGSKMSEATKAKIRNTVQQKLKTDPEFKKQLIDQLKLRPPYNPAWASHACRPETRAKISEVLTGRKLSPAHANKISEGLRRYHREKREAHRIEDMINTGYRFSVIMETLNVSKSDVYRAMYGDVFVSNYYEAMDY